MTNEELNLNNYEFDDMHVKHIEKKKYYKLIIEMIKYKKEKKND